MAVTCPDGCQPAVDTRKKVMISMFAALIFLIISSPYMYNLTNKIFLGKLAMNGCPTLLGLGVHTFVFFLIVLGSMYL